MSRRVTSPLMTAARLPQLVFFFQLSISLRRPSCLSIHSAIATRAVDRQENSIAIKRGSDLTMPPLNREGGSRAAEWRRYRAINWHWGSHTCASNSRQGERWLERGMIRLQSKRMNRMSTVQRWRRQSQTREMIPLASGIGRGLAARCEQVLEQTRSMWST